jgi:hypothetical protein
MPRKRIVAPVPSIPSIAPDDFIFWRADGVILRRSELIQPWDGMKPEDVMFGFVARLADDLGALCRKMNDPSERGDAGLVYGRWVTWLATIPRFHELETYIQTVLLNESLADGLKEVRKILVGQLKRRFEEVDRMTVSEVMETLERPLLATAPLLEGTETAPKPIEAAKQTRARGRNQERDEFVALKYEAGMDVKIIVEEANANRAWAPIADESHCRHIYTRLCEKKGVTAQTRKPSRI